MKTIIALLAIVALTGCTSSTFKKLDSQIPDGNWEKADVKIIGEIINAKISASGLKENGKWTYGEINGTYNGYFVKEMTIDLKKSPPSK